MLLIALLACTPALDLPPPDSLPDQVYVRTNTESFNTDWYVAVRDGRIWVKPNEHTGERDPGAWELLGKTGLPEGSAVKRFDDPQEIVELSADGCHLHALSSAGVFYRGTDLRNNVHSSFKWTDRWGWPRARGPGITEGSFSREGGWSVSDSHPFDVDHYTDIAGNEHSVGLGVAHLYRLHSDGHHIHWSDWWLPADWSRQVCPPERGTLELVALSASASTLFALSADGRLYTRLWDYDTSCENDLFTCSYLVDGPAGSTRALPAEPWAQQPAVPDGQLTTALSIHQDGEGNSARVLRVEARRGRATGYWEKRIDAAEWTWVETGAPLVGQPVEPTDAPAPTEPEEAWLSGTLSREDLDQSWELELTDFHLFCSPATARVHLGQEVLELPWHHVHGQEEEIRDDDWADQGQTGTIRGALLLRDADWSALSDEALEDAEALFGQRKVLVFEGQAGRESLDLWELEKGSSFRFPREEEGEKGELFRIVVE